MTVRAISEARLSTLTARMLAGASVLSMVGVGLFIRFAWDAAGVTFGPEGEMTGEPPALAQRLPMVMLDLSYRQLGIPLVLSSLLAAAAVATLHRHPSREQVRRLRWEVMVAGLLTLVVVVLFALANLYVLAGPAPVSDQPFGIPSPVEMTAGNLTTLAASLLTLTVATLWWVRLPADEPDAKGLGDVPEPLADEDSTVGEPAEEETSRDRSHSVDDQIAPDYRRDWSPEDFRPPR